MVAINSHHLFVRTGDLEIGFCPSRDHREIVDLEIDQSHTRTVHDDPVDIDDYRSAQNSTVQIDVDMPRPVVIVAEVLDELDVRVLEEGHVRLQVGLVYWIQRFYGNLHWFLLVLVPEVANFLFGSIDERNAGNVQSLTGRIGGNISVGLDEQGLLDQESIVDSLALMWFQCELGIVPIATEIGSLTKNLRP